VLYFWAQFLNLATKEKGLATQTRLFLRKNSPLSPHYEGKKLEVAKIWHDS
jgi:hypothetical protein